MAFGKERLGGYKYPREVHMLPSLPLTPVGKVDRKALRGSARSGRRCPVTTQMTIEELEAAGERDLGTSGWRRIDQHAIDALRRGDRRRPVDPRRPRARGGGSSSAGRSRTAT